MKTRTSFRFHSLQRGTKPELSSWLASLSQTSRPSGRGAMAPSNLKRRPNGAPITMAASRSQVYRTDLSRRSSQSTNPVVWTRCGRPCLKTGLCPRHRMLKSKQTCSDDAWLQIFFLKCRRVFGSTRIGRLTPNPPIGGQPPPGRNRMPDRRDGGATSNRYHPTLRTIRQHSIHESIFAMP